MKNGFSMFLICKEITPEVMFFCLAGSCHVQVRSTRVIRTRGRVASGFVVPEVTCKNRGQSNSGNWEI